MQIHRTRSQLGICLTLTILTTCTFLPARAGRKYRISPKRSEKPKVKIDIDKVKLGEESPVTFDQKVNNESDYVHPSVLYFKKGWNGHKYWMGITPYPNTQGYWENPMLFYSDDGINWRTPKGLKQPIYPKEKDVGNNSDSHIFMDYDGKTMHYLNRGAFKKGGSMTEIFSTKDGVHFTPRKRILVPPEFPNYVSVSVCKVNRKYYMFGVDCADLNSIAVLEAKKAEGPWKPINKISTGKVGKVWHPEVRYTNKEFILLTSTGNWVGGDLALGKFKSVMAKEITWPADPLLIKRAKRRLYKCSLVIKGRNDIEIYVGWKSNGRLDYHTDWRVSRAKLLKQ